MPRDRVTGFPLQRTRVETNIVVDTFAERKTRRRMGYLARGVPG